MTGYKLPVIEPVEIFKQNLYIRRYEGCGMRVDRMFDLLPDFVEAISKYGPLFLRQMQSLFLRITEITELADFFRQAVCRI